MKADAVAMVFHYSYYLPATEHRTSTCAYYDRERRFCRCRYFPDTTCRHLRVSTVLYRSRLCCLSRGSDGDDGALDPALHQIPLHVFIRILILHFVSYHFYGTQLRTIPRDISLCYHCH